jgi:hypothetical protein
VRDEEEPAELAPTLGEGEAAPAERSRRGFIFEPGTPGEPNSRDGGV